ncbi:hypothetical protein [Pedobacter miscanthi]|uniref:Uncharacterized protein n=1 Tax=Pedobacter miscanthi TaxID=2259170 RepID=A0A366KM18_9SPHI|nr:hypothetical protein [Pedobacter miscanthi]RBQ02705.1 hypothetical protein DRW42_25510 [Pedobacter miscanthi]
MQQIISYIKTNLLMSLCFIGLFSLCLYQTWLRHNEAKVFNELEKSLNDGRSNKYLLSDLKFHPVVTDSLSKLKNGKFLVLRFIRNNCHQCIDSIFSNVEKIGAKIGKENIAVLVDSPDIGEFYKYKRIYQDKIVNFYYFPFEISSFDKQGTSYYCILAKDKKSASFIFQTSPLDFPVATNRYLKEVIHVF